MSEEIDKMTPDAEPYEKLEGSGVNKIVTPGRQQHHDSAAKAWVNFNGQGTIAIKSSYNVTSLTDNGTGDYTVNLTNSMSRTRRWRGLWRWLGRWRWLGSNFTILER